MEARKTSNLKVAGSSPAMDFNVNKITRNIVLNPSHRGAEEACQAHNLEVVGSKPTDALFWY